jgi:hypothetical protein
MNDENDLDSPRVSGGLERFSQFIYQYANAEVIPFYYNREDRKKRNVNTFDPIILQRLFKVVGKTHLFKEYLRFNRVQDMRSHVNAKLDYPLTTNLTPIQDEDFWKKIFVEHDSQWDVLADLLRYQTILRLENDLEQPKR